MDSIDAKISERRASLESHKKYQQEMNQSRMDKNYKGQLV